MSYEYTLELLKKEASLASMNLGTGLTFLGRYDSNHTGYLYQSLFSLSIGLERLMKLILFFESAQINDKVGDKFFYNKGHNLLELYNECEEISDKYGLKQNFSKFDTFSRKGIEILNDFARKDRYFHLNQIEKNMIDKSGEDPYERWDSDFGYMILEKHRSELCNKYNKIVLNNENEVFDSGLNFEDFLLQYKHKYSKKYIYNIIKNLSALFRKQNEKLVHKYPFVDEFFIVFIHSSYTKKSWNPYLRSVLRF